MPQQHVLDDRESEPGASGRARARPVDAVEALGEPRKVLRGDADARVGDREHADARRLDAPRERDAPAFRRVADRVGQEVRQHARDLVAVAVDRRGRADINSVQALLLYNIGEKELTAGELRTRGYYLGSNVSYNLKKLVDMGYIHYKRSETDTRSVRVSLTDKGLDACDVVQNLYQRQLGSLQAVGEVGSEDLDRLNKSLVRLERFWSDQIRYRL